MPRTSLPPPTPLPARPLLSIVIPVFNERDTILTLLERVRAAPTPGWQREIIIVNDGSNDGTGDVLRAWLAEQPPLFRLLELPRNQGKGAALRHGFAQCQGSVVLIQDADLEYDPGDYPALLAPFGDAEIAGTADTARTADTAGIAGTASAAMAASAAFTPGQTPSQAPARVVYGSRILHPDNHRHSALRFYLGGRLVTLVTNLLYGSRLSDEPTGYKLFRRELLQAIPLECEGFEFCPEVTAKLLRLGVAIEEVPIRYAPRKPDEGKKIGWTDGVEALWTLWRWRWKNF